MLKEHYQKQIDQIMDTYDFQGIIELIKILNNNDLMVRDEDALKKYENEIWLRKEARRLLTLVSVEELYASIQSDCLLEAQNVDGRLSLYFAIYDSNNFLKTDEITSP